MTAHPSGIRPKTDQTTHQNHSTNTPGASPENPEIAYKPPSKKGTICVRIEIVVKSRVTVFYAVLSILLLVSLKDFRSESLPESRGTEELQGVQRQCKTDHSISSYDQHIKELATINDYLNVTLL